MAAACAGVWHTSRAAAPALRESGDGAIVNVSSIGASTTTGSSIPYSVSKAGADQLTKLLARTLAPEVRVNSVAPGFVRTPLTDLDQAEMDALTTLIAGRS